MYIDIKDAYLILSFPYGQKSISFVKTLIEHRWDPCRKVWKVTASLENLKTVVAYFKDVKISAEVVTWKETLLAKQRQIQFAQKFKTTTLPTDYTFKTKPFDHQIQCFNFFKEINIGGLFLEMGLGKTKVVIDIISYFRLMGKVTKPVLYVCPNSILENVKREFELHSPLEWDICVLYGPKQKKINLLAEKEHDLFIINYEAVRTIEQALTMKDFDVIICDESTRIKNPRALCAKALHRLGARVKYRYILTGTPITQNAVDVYSQFKFLEPSIFSPSFYAFKNKYAIMGGFQNHQITGYRNLEDLHEKIFSVALRFTKKECLDLPDKIYEVKQFDLTPEEQKLYEMIKENILTEIADKKITAQLAITKLTKLMQIASGFVIDDEGGTMVFEKASKLKLLKELIEDILPHKIIIWNNFTANIDMVSSLLSSMNIQHVTFDGRIKQTDRHALVEEFQNNPDCKVFVGQIRTGGMGLNLTAASYVIYFTNTYSLADRLQSEDRAHRIGQVNKVTYIDLVARGTIEKSILSILQKKLSIAKLVIDNTSLEDLANGKY